ncbi:6-pyruvoyl trahydropterin synthase family protein [Bdellovibrio reynosensis]|uniref:6-carboxy-5,6,7,8-tetrahydropterin synthase n=1 Tax=Bdellovibrio reynosensis TaxID=2835041 RepID=A0ABY4CCF0_9BACT|nr:6-carboxytetrahydropterin synthase [Bdellovibrio reynosensis]UOF02114.1 6-carboxytetrahydropterin synthase [Bdellovibrio reynosensis]
MSTTTLHLAKQNFKFSAAHFLIFDEKHAERLHGHNYQVRVDIKAPTDKELHGDGYFMDFNVFKKYIKRRLDQWDEIVLLPKEHPDMKFNQTDKSLEVTFRDRFYVFPLSEVLLLPVSNTSVEQLSRLLAEDFYGEFKQYGVAKVKVYVEETRGQGASTVAPF